MALTNPSRPRPSRTLGEPMSALTVDLIRKGLEPRAAVVPAGHECLQRILAFIRDADVDAHDSLHNDVTALHALMIRWRIVAQRWTPGGSEYMDPDYCERFIQLRREEAVRDKKEIHRLRSEIERLKQERAA